MMGKVTWCDDCLFPIHQSNCPCHVKAPLFRSKNKIRVLEQTPRRDRHCMIAHFYPHPQPNDNCCCYCYGYRCSYCYIISQAINNMARNDTPSHCNNIHPRIYILHFFPLEGQKDIYYIHFYICIALFAFLLSVL